MTSMTDDSTLLDLVRLNLVSGLGPRNLNLLLETFGDPRSILRATGDQLLRIPGIGPKTSAAITKAKNSDEPESELEACRQKQITLLSRLDDAYPKSLREICDPPILLYTRGELQPADTLAVAIVGSRRCTHYGRQQAERIAGGLARAGVTVISGMARGIDASAHRGALDAGGRTIAVCAPGLNYIYPPEHKDLANEITSSGAIVTESPLNRGPVPGLFPQRNRIISGMSLGVIIVEAARTSGALHTARHAMEQGRDVFAVPGRIDQRESEGCHDLIRDGAQLIRGVDDVLESLGPLAHPVQTSSSEVVHSPRELSLTDQERLILNLVTKDPQLVDAIIDAADIEPSRVMATLTMLEMKRLIQRLPGNSVVRI